MQLQDTEDPDVLDHVPGMQVTQYPDEDAIMVDDQVPALH